MITKEKFLKFGTRHNPKYIVSQKCSTTKEHGEKSTVLVCIYNKGNFGGTAWESNPPDLARRSQTVLKTVEDTSTPFSPMDVK